MTSGIRASRFLLMLLVAVAGGCEASQNAQPARQIDVPVFLDLTPLAAPVDRLPELGVAERTTEELRGALELWIANSGLPVVRDRSAAKLRLAAECEVGESKKWETQLRVILRVWDAATETLVAEWKGGTVWVHGKPRYYRKHAEVEGVQPLDLPPLQAPASFLAESGAGEPPDEPRYEKAADASVEWNWVRRRRSPGVGRCYVGSLDARFGDANDGFDSAWSGKLVQEAIDLAEFDICSDASHADAVICEQTTFYLTNPVPIGFIRVESVPTPDIYGSSHKLLILSHRGTGYSVDLSEDSRSTLSAETIRDELADIVRDKELHGDKQSASLDIAIETPSEGAQVFCDSLTEIAWDVQGMRSGVADYVGIYPAEANDFSAQPLLRIVDFHVKNQRGKLTWRVPADMRQSAYRLAISACDKSGRFTTQSITISVRRP